MYLSELFLKVLNGDYSNQSVKKAVGACNQDMEQRIGSFDDETKLRSIFFMDDMGEENVTDLFTELMDFWEVYSEFDNSISREEKGEFLILRLVYEVDGIYQCMKNEKLLAGMEKWEIRNLKKLCMEIERIYNAKVIKFLVEEEGGLEVKYEMPLDEFEESLLSFHYVAIQNRIIEMMQSEGIAVVLAGSKGLTPQRLHGFFMGKNQWISCPTFILNYVRDLIFKENKLAKRRGDLRGTRF